MFPALNIGGAVLPTAPLTIIFGAYLALSLVERAGKVLTIYAEEIYQLASTSLIAGIVGARLFFVASHWSAYQGNLLGVLWPINTGFNVWAGLVIGVGTAFFYGRYRELDPAKMLDVLTPGILVGLIAISLADFLAGPGFGTISNLPWAVSLFGLKRHPVQLYEIIVALIALLVWWRSIDRRAFTGQLFLSSIAVYSAGRLFVDAFREESLSTTGGYHVVQIFCLTIVLLFIYLIMRQMPERRA